MPRPCHVLQQQLAKLIRQGREAENSRCLDLEPLEAIQIHTLATGQATQTPHRAPRSTQLTQLPYRGSTNVQSHLITSRDCMTKPLSTASQTQTDCSARLSVGWQSLQKQYPKIDLYIRLIGVKLPPIPAKSSMSSDC